MTANNPWGNPPPTPAPAPAYERSNEWPYVKRVEPAPAAAADPWGAPPTPPAINPAPDPWGTPPAPAGSDAWQTSPPLAPSSAVDEPMPDHWHPKHVAHLSGGTTIPSDGRIYAEASKNNVPDHVIDETFERLAKENAPERWQDVPGVDWAPAPIPADFDKDEWKQGGWDANSQALSRVMGNEPGDAPQTYWWHAESGSGVIANDESEAEEYSNAGCDEVSAERFVELQAHEKREREWTEARLGETEERARFINALNETRGREYVVNLDGELDKLDEVKRGTPKAFYVAYRKPDSLLHAILAGPYDSIADASLRAETAFQRMSDDTAFKLAFDSVFDRVGLYYAELPSTRKGAYGKL